MPAYPFGNQGQPYGYQPVTPLVVNVAQPVPRKERRCAGTGIHIDRRVTARQGFVKRPESYIRAAGVSQGPQVDAFKAHIVGIGGGVFRLGRKPLAHCGKACESLAPVFVPVRVVFRIGRGPFGIAGAARIVLRFYKDVVPVPVEFKGSDI